MSQRVRARARLGAMVLIAALSLNVPGVAAAATTAPFAGSQWSSLERVLEEHESPAASVSSAFPRGKLTDLPGADAALPYLVGDEPSEAATDDIPRIMLRLYQEAAEERCEGLPWGVLAGMGKVASDHGRDYDTAAELEQGPLRWPLASWREHAVDGDGNGVVRRVFAVDAIHSAANFLCEHDGHDLDELRDALLAFNDDSDWVEQVLGEAVRYTDAADPLEADAELAAAEADDEGSEVPSTRQAPPSAPPSSAPLPAPATPTSELPQRDVAALLANPNLRISGPAAADIREGRIDGRVVGLLAALVRDHTIDVIVLQSGHSRYIAGTTKESHHYHGRAVDIGAIDGERVSAGSAKAYALALWLDSLPPSLRPAEVGSPFRDLTPKPGFFTDHMHQNHLHVGWAAR